MTLLPLAARISAGLTTRSAVTCNLALRIQETFSAFDLHVHGRRGQHAAAEADADEITIEVSANGTSIKLCCQSRSWLQYVFGKRERVLGKSQLRRKTHLRGNMQKSSQLKRSTLRKAQVSIQISEVLLRRVFLTVCTVNPRLLMILGYVTGQSI